MFYRFALFRGAAAAVFAGLSSFVVLCVGVSTINGGNAKTIDRPGAKRHARLEKRFRMPIDGKIGCSKNLNQTTSTDPFTTG